MKAGANYRPFVKGRGITQTLRKPDILHLMPCLPTKGHRAMLYFQGVGEPVL